MAQVFRSSPTTHLPPPPALIIKDRVRACESCSRPDCQTANRDYAAEIAALEVTRVDKSNILRVMKYIEFSFQAQLEELTKKHPGHLADNESLPTIYAITPTYARPIQEQSSETKL